MNTPEQLHPLDLSLHDREAERAEWGKLITHFAGRAHETLDDPRLMREFEERFYVRVPIDTPREQWPQKAQEIAEETIAELQKMVKLPWQTR